MSGYKVQKWRTKTKQRIVESMGGSCVCCGYNKCSRALDLHHIDPSKKDISIADSLSAPKAWKKLIIELRKCVLVCNRCHAEIHDGISQLPTSYKTFNEEYAKFKEIYDDCPICGKKKKVIRITCSIECSGKKSSKVNWDLIDLENMLKNKNLTSIAKELKISDSAVLKRAKKLGLK